MSEDWDFYFCTVDHKIASIFVDLGVRDQALDLGLEELVWLRLFMKSPRDDGLSSNDEFDTLVEIEEALIARLADHAERIVFVGRNTSDGTRDFYFYTDDGAWAESIVSAGLSPFSSYEFETGTRLDAGWDAYHVFLYPSKWDLQLIQNRRVLTVLEQEGDRSDRAREIQHWAYFETASARDRFSAKVCAKGYREAARRDDADPPRPFGVSIRHQSDVEPDTINTITLELFDLVNELDGEYDGWETSVERV